MSVLIRSLLFVCIGALGYVNCTTSSDSEKPLPLGTSLPFPTADCDGPTADLTPVVQEQMEATLDAQAQARDELLNPDVITVVTCGTGTPLGAVRVQACTAVFVNGQFLLFDAGDGAQRSMENLLFPISDLTAVFITHFHSDHMADVGEVVSRSWLRGRRTPLTVYGGEGISRVVEGFNSIYALDTNYRVAHHGAERFPRDLAPGIPSLIETPGSEGRVVYNHDGVTVTAYRVNHPPVEPALGYRVDFAGKSVVISGDTAVSESLASMSQGADILVSEVLSTDLIEAAECASQNLGNADNAQILRDVRTYHISVPELAATAADAGVGKLILTHMVPGLDNEMGINAFFTAPISAVFSGEVIAAEDGTKVVLEH